MFQQADKQQICRLKIVTSNIPTSDAGLSQRLSAKIIGKLFSQWKRLYS